MVEHTDDGSGFGFVLDGDGALDATVPRPKSREVNLAFTAIGEGSNADALSLQVLESTADIQEALASAGNDCNRSAAELSQIGRDVHAGLSAAVHTTQTTSTEDLDARQLSQNHGSSNRSAAVEVLAR